MGCGPGASEGVSAAREKLRRAFCGGAAVKPPLLCAVSLDSPGRVGVLRASLLLKGTRQAARRSETLRMVRALRETSRRRCRGETRLREVELGHELGTRAAPCASNGLLRKRVGHRDVSLKKQSHPDGDASRRSSGHRGP